MTITGAIAGGLGGAGGGGGSGAIGGFGGIGGDGVTFLAGGALSNAGSIAGGNGGYGGYAGPSNNSAAGGIGASFVAGGSLDNSGTISGGVGGYGTYRGHYGGNGGNGGYGAAGGAGVAFDQGGSLSNSGLLVGGAGGYGGTGGIGGVAGVGGSGGAGIVFTNGGMGTNSVAGQISGGVGGHGGYGTYGGSGRTGGIGGAGGAGGSGVTGSAFTLTNAGVITGGNGGIGGSGGSYSSGVAGQSGNGTGGVGGTGGLGGDGVNAAGFSLVNSGSISGGSGGAGGLGGGGGYGGISGTPGNGGAGGLGGNGGRGISGSAFSLTNNGSVAGGNGGSAGTAGTGGSNGSGALGSGGVDGNPGLGGAAINGMGGVTIIIAGNISGGRANGGAGTLADAIDFSGGGNTLVITAGAVITGNVVSTSGTVQGGDTLTLGGATNATGGNNFDVSQIGSVGSAVQYQGFTGYEKDGASTWSLIGASSALTPWTVKQGTLSIAADASLGASSGTLTLDGGVLQNTASFSSSRAISLGNAGGAFDTYGNTLTLNGVIAGGGGLTEQGGGTLVLNGINTYSGGTTISSGTLEVGDSAHESAAIQGGVTVSASGTLRGHGTINGDVASDGVVWPGGSTGELTINGNYTQGPGGLLQIDVTPAQTSELLVTGTASLAGAINLIYAPGTYTKADFTILQAKAISGTFGTTSITGLAPSALSPQLVYSGGQVVLELGAVAPPATPPPSSPSSPSQPVTPPPATTPERIAPLDGALYGNLMRAANLADQQVLSSALDASLMDLDAACGKDANASTANLTHDACGPDLWMQYAGSSLSLTGDNGANATGFHLLAGSDRELGLVHVGFEAGLGRINANDSLGGRGNIDSAHAGIYAFGNAGPLVLSATVDEAHDHYRADRSTGIGRATADTSGNTTSAGVQASWPISLATWQWEPKLGALYIHQGMDGFEESVHSSNSLAPAFAVSGARTTYSELQPFAEVAFGRAFQADNVAYIPTFTVGYRYDARSVTSPAVRLIAQDGTLFDYPGATLGRGMVTAGAHVSAQVATSWDVYLNYNGLFASHLHDNTLAFGFTKHW
ncbi:autotransporter domain-containing protein [Dyella sp. C11]|uniref:autotransporter outer membrane beta-barrel domain-containing protein n=1 Tax=Dyella sp. C11 TaxID=2126991 RepID=UPI0013004BF5|nr:autotransporter domain-containing protein [Dyella sp. C11]